MYHKLWFSPIGQWQPPSLLSISREECSTVFYESVPNFLPHFQSSCLPPFCSEFIVVFVVSISFCIACISPPQGSGNFPPLTSQRRPSAPSSLSLSSVLGTAGRGAAAALSSPDAGPQASTAPATRSAASKGPSGVGGTGVREGMAAEEKAEGREEPDSMLAIVCDQRDRFKKQLGAVEEEASKLRVDLGEHSV